MLKYTIKYIICQLINIKECWERTNQGKFYKGQNLKHLVRSKNIKLKIEIFEKLSKKISYKNCMGAMIN